MNKIVKYFKVKKDLTAERPTVLVADALARYYFAKRYCKNKIVLDLGTGFGLGANYLAKHGAKEVVGVDYNRDVVKRASRNKAKNLSYRALDVLEIERLERKFDVILAFEIIEHLPLSRVGEFVAAMVSCLEPGGMLLLTTPNKENSRTFLGRPYNPYHVKEYTDSELNEIFSKYFTDVEIKGLRCKNDLYKSEQANLENTLVYKISFFVGHFKLVRELLAFIPRNLKRRVTREETLPDLTEKDYELASAKASPGLFVIAKDTTGRNYLPFVSVVIANYNGERFLANCLRSVLRSDYKNFEVIVGDDCSTDRSLEIVGEFQKKDKRVRFVKNPKNIGAAGTRNKAVNKARGDVLVFLDNDTVVVKNWIKAIVKVFENRVVGGVQALLLDFEKKELVQHAGGLIMPQVGWLKPRYQWKKHKAVKQSLQNSEIAAVSAALAVRRHVFLTVGGFDEKESVYTEDIDFSWRVWLSGYKIVLAKDALVYHLAKKVDERKFMGGTYFSIYYHLAKNSFRSIIKNYEIQRVLLYLPQSMFINLARGVMVLVLRKNTAALMGTLKALTWNIAAAKNTLSERNRIQNARFFSDRYIMNKVFERRSIFEIYK